MISRFSGATPVGLHYDAYRQPARYEVLGKRATSYEYNVAMAMNYYKIGYIFQVQYFGGRRLRGGFVVDFMAFTVPFPTPVWVNGNYWHSGPRALEDFFQQALVGEALAGEIQRPVIFWGEDSYTFDAAKLAVRRELL
jgi:hypothetical protein